MDAEQAPAARTVGVGLGLLLTATVLFWWTATDRLDLPKQTVLALGAVALAGWGVWRWRLRVDAVSLGLCLAAGILLALQPVETSARVEGLVGWLAAGLLVIVARATRPDDLEPYLARLAVGLAGLAWLQALGTEVFNADLTGLHGRRVVGTLGGPGQLGWVLALLLPWVGWRAARLRADWLVGLGLVIGALVLSGSRTAWVMSLVGLACWLPRRRLLGLVLAMALGAGVAVGADAVTGRARLGERAADLTDGRGTAAGRLYLWRVAAFNASDLLGPGHGPEGFQRRWPDWQRSYLAQAPDQIHFRSDLRHAHSDPVEVACDLGVGGLVLIAWVLVLAVLRPAAQARWRGPALAGLLSSVVGGLAAPLLFFAPSLGLAAVFLGLRLGPMRRALPRWVGLVCLVAVVAVCVPLVIRLDSEVSRSQATAARARSQTDVALESAAWALHLDERNPRAWIELGLARQAAGWPAAAREAFCQAAVDLPADAVVQRCRSVTVGDGALPASR